MEGFGWEVRRGLREGGWGRRGDKIGRVEGSVVVVSFDEGKAGGAGEMRTASIDFHPRIFPSIFSFFSFTGILTTTSLSNLFVFDPVFK